MMRLKLGPSLGLPAEWMTLATVVYGARGSGKTCFGRRVAEEANKLGQRFCAVDLKGDWYGLKSSADGKSDGLPVVVFGGDHADLPLEEGAGAFVAETVASIGQSTVIDLEHFSKGKQVRFLAAFFDRLYDANRETLLLLLDEAQRYAPQSRMMDPDHAKCLGAVEDLVKLGRKHGIGPVLFTQRGSGLNKEVSELCDMLVAFRTPGPLDQARVKDWLDANTTKEQRDQVMGRLSGLPTGTAVFASGHPDLKVFGVYEVSRPETFDSSATPKPGQKRIVPKKLAEPDLVALRERMADAIARVKADDPKELRRRILELEKELKARGPLLTVKPATIEVPVFDDERFAAIGDKAHEALRKAEVQIGGARVDIMRALEEYREKCRVEAKLPRRIREPLIVRPPTTAIQMVNKLVNKANGSSELKRLDRAILTVLAQHPEGLTKKRILIHAGYSPSGDVSSAFAAMTRDGYVEPSGTGALRITDHGLRTLGAYDPLPVGDELRASLLVGDKLNRVERSLLQVICDAYPHAIAKGKAVKAAGYSPSGDVSSAFAKLAALGYVVKVGPGELAASRDLFT